MSRSGEFFTGAAKRSKEGNEWERGSTEYMVGTGENAVGTQSGGHIVVKHPFTTYDYPSEFEERDWNTGEVNQDESDKNWFKVNDVRPGQQIPMFKVNHKPAVLDAMFSTKDATPQTTALAAHAVADTERRFGQRPLASDNTSAYSTKFVNSAIKHGLIPGVVGQEPGELASQGNSYDFKAAHDVIQNRASRFAEGLDDNYGDSTYVPISQADIEQDKRSLALEALSNKKTAKEDKGVDSARSSNFTDGAKQLEFEF